MKKIKRGRGRPVGFKMLERSKKAISESKKGYKHKEETIEKIRLGVQGFWDGEIGMGRRVVKEKKLTQYEKGYRDGFESGLVAADVYGDV